MSSVMQVLNAMQILKNRSPDQQGYTLLTFLDDWCRTGEFDKLKEFAKEAEKEDIFFTYPSLGLMIINQMRLAHKLGDFNLEDGKDFYLTFKVRMKLANQDLTKILHGYEAFEDVLASNTKIIDPKLP